MSYLCLAAGLWLLYVTWDGVVPTGLAAWGKNESGQKMRRGQRILFGVGGLLFLGLSFIFRKPH